MTTPISLAFRLQRMNLIIWSFAMLLFGMSYGSFLGEAEEMMNSMGGALNDMLAELEAASFVDSIADMLK